LCVISFSALAQNVKFSFANPETTYSNGNAYFETDVVINSQTAEAHFILSSGQLYPNYNAEAFGDNIVQNNAVEITYPSESHLLGAMDNVSGVMRVYSDVILNDNTASRFSVAWQQSRSANCIGQEVNTIPVLLFHIKIKFLPGAENISPELCFEDSELFVYQIYTACGVFTGDCSFETANCHDHPGEQIMNNQFDCSETVTNVSVTNPDETINEVQLFPNPTDEEFSIQFTSTQPESAKLMIKDLLGRTLYEQNINIQTGQNSFDLNVRQYAIGTYLLEIHTQGNAALLARKFTKI